MSKIKYDTPLELLGYSLFVSTNSIRCVTGIQNFAAGSESHHAMDLSNIFMVTWLVGQGHPSKKYESQLG